MTNATDRPIDAPDQIPAGRLALSVSEVAALIGVSPRQIYTLAHKAGLPTVKILGRRLVRRADLEAWLAAQPVDCLTVDGPEAVPARGNP